ncbi:MAG: Asp-tRNA(Asn)/Glu-tRNA(Gln) amidotransferase subunit GatA [Methanocalculus sp.]|uniref:Asp-tRNA(Asn)/Glu-tRNA(Gln) amidotransferase subunit GatA n=1 Tax=Methanocalculus sp. TaxID=2004547 RepID=UPI00272030C3|nr:Asp-tRNA(Asn)/Glu-tRNA(Gln) amidotransferase subunit GatA [Methanocalculus sp.]MDO9539040.1 Asp-tRNA(Asn)/Glu-tRNA(Gln) amidotransferase subunit GatA [Methanocalculus sp.]
MGSKMSFDKPDPDNAFITLCREIDYQEGPLSGIPIAIKDNISTAGIQTTCGSKILKGYIPPYDAHVITLIRSAGGAIVGKTNMDEFGMGTTTESSAFGPTTNPVDPTRVPGGSSGGSAAAVASGLVRMALGTDTGGSIRCPASFCGIVGLKPTYGRVSRYGLIAYANSLEQIGPLARNVRDCALLYSCIAGYDPRDGTSLDLPAPAPLRSEIQGKRIGVPAEFFGEGVDPAVASVVQSGIQRLEELGAVIVPCSMPSMRYALAAYYVTSMSEASSNLGRYDGVRYGQAPDTVRSWHDAYSEIRRAGFGEEVRRRILLGSFALSAGYQGKYYAKAQAARQMVRDDFERLFESVDIIAGPTMPTVAFRLGETSDPLSMYLADILTVPANLAGVPALSVPCGTAHGMPVGLQLIGRHFAEDEILAAALAFEEGSA